MKMFGKFRAMTQLFYTTRSHQGFLRQNHLYANSKLDPEVVFFRVRVLTDLRKSSGTENVRRINLTLWRK